MSTKRCSIWEKVYDIVRGFDEQYFTIKDVFIFADVDSNRKNKQLSNVLRSMEKTGYIKRVNYEAYPNHYVFDSEFKGNSPVSIMVRRRAQRKDNGKRQTIQS